MGPYGRMGAQAGLLDRRQCRNRLFERLRANMSVIVAYRLRLVADQFHTGCDRIADVAGFV